MSVREAEARLDAMSLDEQLVYLGQRSIEKYGCYSCHDIKGAMMTDDNTFGSPLQDARRRDFTINGLFYNIADFSVLDYVGGLDDLERCRPTRSRSSSAAATERPAAWCP